LPNAPQCSQLVTESRTLFCHSAQTAPTPNAPCPYPVMINSVLLPTALPLLLPLLLLLLPPLSLLQHNPYVVTPAAPRCRDCCCTHSVLSAFASVLGAHFEQLLLPLMAEWLSAGQAAQPPSTNGVPSLLKKPGLQTHPNPSVATEFLGHATHAFTPVSFFTAAYVFPAPHLTHGGEPLPAMLTHPLGQAHARFEAGQRQSVLVSSGTSPAGQAMHADPVSPNLPVDTRSMDIVSGGQSWQGRVEFWDAYVPTEHLRQLRPAPGALVAPNPAAHTARTHAARTQQQQVLVLCYACTCRYMYRRPPTHTHSSSSSSSKL
jgi:hypothetical protein